ncbi:DUF924 family protein [Pseudorhodoferax sp.]|uniref:DUF924 family protein n=1 Tax=Pseudorhodoferax sp. TaxID=1993553 RepID=UPI002DD62092|nr:DUF924 family protein [Pseudorhodoferax sp.]
MTTPAPLPADAAEVLRFWRDAGPERWFRKDEAFDRDFRERFLALHFAAARRELDGWMASADGTLALLILLDQFPRNAFRGTAHMYATDPLARHVARHARAAGYLQQVEPALALFLNLPFVHSEDLADQALAVAQSATLGAVPREHAEGHRDIVQRFGRFPHRNRLLARETSAAEQAFLDQGGFAG